MKKHEWKSFVLKDISDLTYHVRICNLCGLSEMARGHFDNIPCPPWQGSGQKKDLQLNEMKQILDYLEHSSRIFSDAKVNFEHAMARLILLIREKEDK